MIALTRILCPVDLSEFSKHALAHAAAVASWYESQLTVLHVFSDVPVFDVAPALGATPMPPLSLKDIDRDQLLAVVHEFVAPIARGPSVDVRLVEAADPRRSILDEASQRQADLVVMGTHGRSGFDYLLLGSVTEKVIRKAPCPVLIVPPHAREAARSDAAPFKRIVCGVDFSESSKRALCYALDFAREADARITLLHVVEVPPELGEFPFSREVTINGIRAAADAEYLRRLRALVPPEARDYCTPLTQVSEGRAHKEILRVAAEEQADLVVMGVHGRGAIDLMLFGSNAHAVIRGAACPVLVVPTARKQ
jgi:nucleotide-binding universal stress UspA family protein